MNRAWRGATPLLIASRLGFPAVLKVLVAEEADLEWASEGGEETALLGAVRGGHVEAVQVLVKAGAGSYTKRFSTQNFLAMKFTTQHHLC